MTIDAFDLLGNIKSSLISDNDVGDAVYILITAVFTFQFGINIRSGLILNSSRKISLVFPLFFIILPEELFGFRCFPPGKQAYDQIGFVNKGLPLADFRFQPSEIFFCRRSSGRGAVCTLFQYPTRCQNICL